MSEKTEVRVALYGRFADDLTREALAGRAFGAALSTTGQTALRKDDGYFAFTDLAPSTIDYQVRVNALTYQRRTLSVKLPTAAPVEIAYPGEDELFVMVNTVDAPSRRVSFERLPFVPTIQTGSPVFGPGTFAATLDQPLEGGEVEFAVLSSVAGLANGALLRVVRSRNVILSPDPYHPFARGTTLVAVKVVENTSDAATVADALVAMDQVNSLPITIAAIQGVNIHTVTLSPSRVLVLGTERAVQTRTNERGDAIFYLPSQSPITALRLQITRPGFVSTSVNIVVTPGSRVGSTVRLDRT